MPEVLSLELTTRCNLRCLDCFAHAGGAAVGDLSLADAGALLAEGARLGFPGLSLTGGEALLWPPLFELLDQARDLGYVHVLINTNAHLLDAAMARRLAAYGPLVELSCSINGDRARHEALRGPGSHAPALAGIRAGLEQGLGLAAYTVVGKPVLDSLPALSAGLFADFPGLKAHVFIQQRGVDDGYYQNTRDKLEPADFVAMVRMAGLLALAGHPVQILENALSTVVARQLGIGWLAPSPEITRPGKVVVLQDKVFTLNHSSSKRLGSWRPGGLADFLQSVPYRELTAPDSATCQDCRFSACCRAAGKLRPSGRFHNTGDPAIPFCQKVLELLS